MEKEMQAASWREVVIQLRLCRPRPGSERIKPHQVNVPYSSSHD